MKNAAAQNWLMTEARDLLLAGNMAGAYAAAMARLAVDREDAGGWIALATVALEGGSAAKALELATRARAVGAEHLWLDVVEGRALLALGKGDEARKIAARARSEISDAHLLDSLGVLRVRTGLHADALPLFVRAAELDPTRAAICYNLATTRQFLGDLAGAAAAYRDVIVIDPAHDRSRLALAQLEAATPERLAELSARFEVIAEQPDQALQIGHAAAKVAEDLGNPIGAMQWLERGKAAKRAATRYDRSFADRLFTAAAAAAERLAKFSKCDAEKGPLQPIFVIGMPRSGTTLIERIIASHRAVASGGELPDFSLLLKRASGSPGALVLDPATLSAPVDLAPVGQAYLARVAPLAGDAPRLTDKMPFNLFYAAHILAALPTARVVMVRRDPRDTVFANFRQLFATGYGYYDYAYSLEDTADWVARFEALCAVQARLLGGPRYSEVGYEAMVADQEGESRRLITALGLPWDPACLDFHANPQPVTTASSVQVRAPIHSGSVGRWQRYGPYATRVETALRASGWTG